MVRPMTWTDEKPRPAGRDPTAEGVELEGTDLFDAAPREAPWTGLLAATPDASDASDTPASGPAMDVSVVFAATGRPGAAPSGDPVGSSGGPVGSSV